MNKILAFAVAGLLSGAAVAQETGKTMDSEASKGSMENFSLFYYAPAPSRHNIELRPGLMNNLTRESKTNGIKTADVTTANNTHQLMYQYTMSDAVTLGATTFFGTVTRSTTPVGGSASSAKYNGMGDLTFKYSGFSPMDNAKLRWGADVGLSPGKAKDASGTTDGNNYTGGMSITPSVAYEMGGSVITWGVGASYALNMERTAEATTVGGSDTKLTGGNVLTLKPYLEVPIASGRVGGYLKYASAGEAKAKTGTAAEVTTASAATTMALGGAVSYNFNETFSGLAELEYTTITSTDAPGSGLALSIGGRAGF